MEGKLIRRILKMIQDKDPMFMLLDDGIISNLYKEHYFNGFPGDDSMKNTVLTKKGEQALNK